MNVANSSQKSKILLTRKLECDLRAKKNDFNTETLVY